jgi:hypothetical protein
MESMIGVMSCDIEIGTYPLFAGLTFNLEVSPKVLRISWIISMFCACAGVKITVSSANCSTVVWKLGNAISRLLALCIIACRVSVAKINSRGRVDCPV